MIYFLVQYIKKKYKQKCYYRSENTHAYAKKQQDMQHTFCFSVQIAFIKPAIMQTRKTAIIYGTSSNSKQIIISE